MPRPAYLPLGFIFGTLCAGLQAACCAKAGATVSLVFALPPADAKAFFIEFLPLWRVLKKDLRWREEEVEAARTLGSLAGIFSGDLTFPTLLMKSSVAFCSRTFTAPGHLYIRVLE